MSVTRQSEHVPFAYFEPLRVGLLKIVKQVIAENISLSDQDKVIYDMAMDNHPYATRALVLISRDAHPLIADLRANLTEDVTVWAQEKHPTLDDTLAYAMGRANHFRGEGPEDAVLSNVYRDTLTFLLDERKYNFVVGGEEEKYLVQPAKAELSIAFSAAPPVVHIEYCSQDEVLRS